MFSMTDEQFNEVKAAKATLINLGYTYHGGEMWKPPLGQPPAYITWEGEGHPPVGALVQYRFSDAERWRYGKVKYITTRNAVLSDETGRDKWVECLDVYFRPYLSTEQRKQNAVAEIVQIMENGGLDSEKIAEAIFDAAVNRQITGIRCLAISE